MKLCSQLNSQPSRANGDEHHVAKHLDFVMGGSGGNILGVCGASPSRDNDYNTARPGHWGEEAKTTYKAGDVIDVAWCVSVATGVKATFQSS